MYKIVICLNALLKLSSAIDGTNALMQLCNKLWLH